MQMSNKEMKRCSIPLIITERQIKTTLTYHLKPIKMAVLFFFFKYWQRCRLCIAGGNVKWCSHYEKNDTVVPQKIKQNYHMIQQFPFWVYTPQN